MAEQIYYIAMDILSISLLAGSILGVIGIAVAITIEVKQKEY